MSSYLPTRTVNPAAVAFMASRLTPCAPIAMRDGERIACERVDALTILSVDRLSDGSLRVVESRQTSAYARSYVELYATQEGLALVVRAEASAPLVS